MNLPRLHEFLEFDTSREMTEYILINTADIVATHAHGMVRLDRSDIFNGAPDEFYIHVDDWAKISKKEILSIECGDKNIKVHHAKTKRPEIIEIVDIGEFHYINYKAVLPPKYVGRECLSGCFGVNFSLLDRVRKTFNLKKGPEQMLKFSVKDSMRAIHLELSQEATGIDPSTYDIIIMPCTVNQ